MTRVILSGIFIYPIKSAGGLSLRQSAVTDRGLQYDRRWMVVNDQGSFISQRQYPAMARVRVKLADGGLVVTTPGMPELVIQAVSSRSVPMQVKIWKDTCVAKFCGKKAAEWFTRLLGCKADLVYMEDHTVRLVDQNFDKFGSRLSFADGFPFLLLSEASLRNLNSRLDESLPMNRFRPNLVVSGSEPYAEDCWKRLQIGSVKFRVVKPCSRCVITTVDQESGAVGKEPLHTLTTYRRREGKVYFGQNLVHTGTGEIHLGDQVIIDK